MNLHVNPVEFSVILTLLTACFSPQAHGDISDLSTFFSCEQNVEPDVGKGICYQRPPSGDPCAGTSFDITVADLTPLSSIFKVATPNFLQNIPSYEAHLECIFNFPSCPENFLIHLQLENGNFDLRPECPIPEFGDMVTLCPDNVRVTGVQLDSFGQITPDSDGNFCGSQSGFSLRFSGRDLKVEFRSGNTDGQFRGFLMDVMCTDPNFEPDNDVDTQNRFRRNANEEIPYRVRGKRLAAPPAEMTAENCTVIRGDRGGPPSTTAPPTTAPEPLQRIGEELQIPNPAYLSYNSKILKVIQNGIVQKTFFNIRRLFFWTGFNGTRIFKGSAPVPAMEIFGGGRLRLVADCAYYVNFNSPPIYEPTSAELQIIGFLLNETNPFFVDRLFPGQATTPPPTTPPPKKYHHSRGRRHSFSAKADTSSYIVKKRSAFHYYYPPLPTPPPPPPKVDPNSMMLASRFVNACNPFLRQASRSYLEIVRGEGAT